MSGSYTVNNNDPEYAYSSIIGVLLLITIVMVMGGIVSLVVTTQPMPDKVPIAYLSVTQSNERIELINKAGDTLTSKSIAIVVDGVDRTTEFRKPENSSDWGSLHAGEHIYYNSPEDPKSVQVIYLGQAGQYLLAYSGPATIAPISKVPSPTPVPTIPAATSPTVTQITPGFGYNNTYMNSINVTGTAFLGGATITLNGTGFADIPATNVTVVSPVKITCSFNLTGVPTGFRNVVVTNSDGKKGMLIGGFKVVHAADDLIADFVATPTNGTAPLTVQFNDTSTGSPVSWQWTFGDDLTNNTRQNPVHQYINPGVFPVHLTVTNADGSYNETKTQYITVSSPVVPNTPPTAQFTSNTIQGQSPLTVQFTDQSTGTGPMTYHWDFSDGEGKLPENSQKNPVWRFWEDDGSSFTVSLTVTNAYGTDTIVKQNYITLGSTPSVASVAAFTSSVRSGTAPLTVQFTDQSIGTVPVTYAWDFNNDGTTDSTVKSPSFSYTSAGTYTVKLTVTNASSSASEIKTNYIAVSSPVVSTIPPIAQFTASPTQGQSPLAVQFTDQSTGTPKSYAWDFNNDGTTDSTVKSPSFSYTSAGTYTVKLTVTNAYGSDSETKTQYIMVSSLSATSECYGAEACNPTGNPIGGGAGYTDIILQTDARVKYVVTTAAGLKSALASARSGEVVFVPSTATIDLTGSSSITIPAGVTLASDRGYSGRPGGLIKRDTSGTIPKGTFIAGGNDVRVTGLRIQGPHSGYGASYGDNVKCAIMETNKNGLEVDNCEIYYWSYAGVAFENSASGSWTGHVHHNNIHHIAGEGYGYGVMVAYGDVLIEANKFDYTRHAVIGEGCPGEKFEYRYNHYGKNSLNPVLDCHRDCGGWSAGGVSGRLYLVHHNTIEYAGSVAYNLYGTPSEKVSIYNNIFPTRIQALNGWTRIYLTNNYFGGVLKASGQ